MKAKLITRLFLCAALLLNAVGAAFAQGATSRVTGVVQDPSGAVISDATVTLTNEETQLSFTFRTTSTGTYVFDSVQIGKYTVTVEKEGFKKFVSPGNSLTIGQPLTLNVTLETGQITETVEVRAAADLVDTSSSGNFGGLLEQQLIERLPIVGTRGRNPLEFVLLAPGVVSGANTGGGIHVHGSRDRAWNFTLDGIDINETSAGGSNFAPLRTNPDMLAEFRVITSNPSAEFGRSSGAQVAMITKTGTNAQHGNAYWFYQTPRFHANSFANNLNNVVRPQFVQHIPGFSVGGPVWIPKVYDGRNKTFFFTNWQWLRTRETRTVTSTVYTEQARNGIFRYVIGGQNAPAGTATASVDAAGNVLPGVNIGTYNVAANDPASRGFDPTIVGLLNLTSLPNNFTVGDGLNTAGFTWTPIQREKQRDLVFKIDHAINDRHTVFGRWAQGYQNTIGDFVNDGWARFPGLPNIVDTFRDPKNLAANWRWTPTARITNEFVFGLNRFAFSFNNPDPNGPTNSPIILNTVADPLARSLEVYNARRLSTYQVVDNVSIIKGSHTFKTGLNFRFQRHLDDRSSVAGVATDPSITLSTAINLVDPVAFRLPTNINTASDRPRLQALVNNLLGRVGRIAQAFVAVSDSEYAPPETHFNFDARYPEYDFYFQDSWKMRPNLTIDLGLRWEIKISPKNPDDLVLRPNQPVTFDAPASNTVQWEEGKLFGDQWRNFAPSVGFAWDPFSTGKTAVRANYRLAYDRLNTFVFSSSIFQSAPGLTLGLSNTEFGQAGGRLTDGLPTLAPPAGVSPQQFRQPASFSTNSITVVDPDLATPRVHQWALGFQREIGWKLVAEVNYIGTAGRKLFGAYNVNQAEIFDNGFVEAFNIVKAGGESSLINQLFGPDPSRRANESGSAAIRRLFPTELRLNSVAALAATLGRRTAGGRPLPEAAGLGPFFFFQYPQFAGTGGLIVLDSHDYSNYHGLEIELNRQFSGGLSFGFSYTWSKSLDTRSFDPAFSTAGGGTNQFGSSTPFDPANRSLNYAVSDFDRRHSFQGGAVFDLPFGAGRRWASNIYGPLEKVIGGWSLTGSVIWQSGRPFTVYSGSNTFSSFLQSPANCDNCSRDMIKRLFERTSGTEFYLNPAERGTFDTATNRSGIFSVPGPGELGNLPRNFFITPAFFNINAAIGKRTRISETHNIEYRLEMQNVTNTPSFGLPNAAVITDATFMRARGNTVSTARRIQMALKYNF
jgi:hypothetical protein